MSYPAWKGMRDESGQTLVLISLFMVVLCGFLALVIDGGNMFLQRRHLQGTADAAAMAGVRELPASVGQASSVAEEYAESRNTDGADVQSIDVSEGSSKLKVMVRKDVPGSFLSVLGMDTPSVHATATARVSQISGIGSALPIGLLKGSYTLGTQKQVRDDPGDKAGLLYPEAEPSCSLANGGNDVRQLIKGPFAGDGMIACPTPIGEVISSNSGWKNGNVKDGFDTRVDSDTDSFEDVTDLDPVTGKYAIVKPNSPRIGVVPVIENVNGNPNWVKNTDVRIIAYVFVYIGKRDSPPSYPPYLNNGKDLYLTPIDAIMPPDYTQKYEFSETWDPSYTGPRMYRLVE
ncbi:MAG: hypothetical protein JWM90_2866 [Thermoleophilia bacterium]|nr:hypothetical protein [Thermoleophilia bacterium]